MLTTLQKFPALVVFLWQTEVAPEQFQSGRSLIWMFTQTIVALAFVCLLAWLVLRVLLPRLNVVGSGKSMVKVIDRTPLDQRRSLYVIEVAGRWLLIGSSEGGVQLISELEAERAEQDAAAMNDAAVSTRARKTFSHARASARNAFADVYERLGNKRP